MPKATVVITSQIEKSHAVGEAWQKAGAPGVTFVEGHGLRRLQEKSRKFEVPLGTLSFLEIVRQTEISSIVIFSVVGSTELAKQLIDTAQTILGDFNEFNTGIAFVFDIEYALGHDKL